MSNENQAENVNNNEIVKQNEKELNDLLKKFDETSESPVVEAQQQPAMEKGKEEIVQQVTEKLVMSLGSLSRMVARHTQVPEIELTDEDKKDLQGALQPLVEMLVDYAEYIKYLPLITFVIGYGVRVADGFKKKKQLIPEKLPEKPKEPEKQPEKQPEKVNENAEKQAEKPEQKPENIEKSVENTEKQLEKTA